MINLPWECGYGPIPTFILKTTCNQLKNLGLCDIHSDNEGCCKLEKGDSEGFWISIDWDNGVQTLFLNTIKTDPTMKDAPFFLKP